MNMRLPFAWIRKYLSWIGPRPISPIEATQPRGATEQAGHRRFLSDNPVLYRQAIEAAQSYVAKLAPGERDWLIAKPFDPTPGNPQYFRLMFDLLNILQAMQIPQQGRILEVGSGPGWVTEILLMLGFSVDALEPADDLNAIAEARCAAVTPPYGSVTPPVRFHNTTLEEIEFDDGSFDAILFFDVLHHVVDEKLALEKSFRFLKPFGCLGVVEGGWHPDFKTLEAGLLAEMTRFGTLENPFFAGYLDELLVGAGFDDIRRYSGVNGFFSQEQLSQPLRNFAVGDPAQANNLTARKPDTASHGFPHCADPAFITDIRLVLLAGAIDSVTGAAALHIRLENVGETMLDGRTAAKGHITLALRRSTPGSPAFVECPTRAMLPGMLAPGQSRELTLLFAVPDGARSGNWELDLVSEGQFWFSSRGIASCPVPRMATPEPD
jgi:SAM-dependent methyltransferase